MQLVSSGGDGGEVGDYYVDGHLPRSFLHSVECLASFLLS
jgi:hypothetical protein